MILSAMTHKENVKPMTDEMAEQMELKFAKE